MNRIYFDGNWHGYVEIENQLTGQDNENVTSNVRVSAKIGVESGYPIEFGNTYGAYLALNIGKETKYLQLGSLYLNGNTKFLGSVDFTVKHDEDGTPPTSLNVWSGDTSGIKVGGYSWGSLSHSIPISIPQINRSGEIESVSPNAELGKPVTVTIKDREEGLEHQVWWKAFGGDWVDLGKKADKVFTFTPSRELHKNAGNSDTGKLDICVRTFKDGKKYGGDVYKENIPIKIPEDIKPTVGMLKLIDKYTNRELENSAVVLQYSSDIEYEITDSSESLTEPVEWHVSINDKHFTGKKGKIGRLDKTGTFFVKAWVVDKRGRESSQISKPITVSEYKAPQLSFVARRSGAKNNTVTVTTTAKIMPLKTVTGRQYNSFSLEFYTRRIEDTQFIKNEGASLKSTSTYELIEHSANLIGSFDVGQSYMVKAVLRDSFQEVEYLFPLSTERVVASYSQYGMGIGKIWERGTLDVGGDIYSNGELVQVGRLTQPNGKSIKLTGSANNAIKTGMYYSANMSDLPPSLENGGRYGYLSVNTHFEDSMYILQNYVPFNSDVMYMRRKTNYGWQPWMKFTPSNVSISEDWQIANLQNGWKNKANYGSVQFSKSVDSVVHFKGVATGGDTTKEVVILILPEGYRPKTQCYVFAMNDSFEAAALSIAEDGRVIIKKNVDERWLGFDNVSFKI